MENFSSKRTFRGTLYLMIAQTAVMGGSYVIAVALARGLGPELYGVYGIVYSILLSVELVGRLGFPQATAKLIAESDTSDHTHEANGFSLALAVYSFIFVVFWLGSPFLADIFNVSDGTRLFRIAAIDIPFYGIFFMLMHILAGRRRFLQQSLANIVYIVTKLVGILLLDYFGPTVSGALLVNVLGSIVALMVLIPFVGMRRFSVTFSHSRPLLRLAGPAALIALGTQVLMGADLWLLNAVGDHVPETVKGYYVAAVSIARMPNFVAFVLTSVLIPTIARSAKVNDPALMKRTIDGTVRFMAIGLLASSAFMSANAEPIMTLIFSDEYAQGSRYLSVLVFAQGCFLPIYMVLSNVLFATGNASKSASLSIVTMVFAIAICGTLASSRGASGAAFGSVFSTFLAAICIFYLLHRYVGFSPSWWMMSKVAVSVGCVGLASVLMQFQGIALIIELMIVAALYLGLLFALGLITRSDLDLLVPGKRNGENSVGAPTTAQG